MTIELSLAIIALTFVLLAGFFVVMLLRVKKAVDVIQDDLHHLSVDTENLVVKLSELATDITKKSQSLNFLFTPLSFFNKKSSSEASSQESSSSSDTIPQLVEWLTTSLILVKKSKEFIKTYVK